MLKESNNFIFFSDFQDIHYKKDVGKIPEYIFKKDGVKREIFSQYGNIKNKFFISEIISQKNLMLLFFHYFYRLFSQKPKYILLFHVNFKTFFITLFSRIISPFSIIYIKGDINHNNFILLPWYKKMAKFLYLIFFKFLNIYISVETSSTYQYIQSTYKFNYKKFLLIPNGVDPIHLSHTLNKEKVFISVGRLGTKVKNTKLLLELFIELSLHLPKWSFFAIGPIEKDFINNHADLIKKIQNHSKIKLLGPLYDSELIEYYKKSIIFILPSRHEGSPLVIPESMQYGCIPISGDIPYVKEISNNFTNGLCIDCLGDERIFTQEDVFAICKSILSFIGNNNIQELGMNCSKTIENIYTREIIIDTLLSSFRTHE